MDYINNLNVILLRAEEELINMHKLILDACIIVSILGINTINSITNTKESISNTVINNIEYNKETNEECVVLETQPFESVSVDTKPGITEEERHELAKLVMAEAGIESLQTKAYIAMVVINRVNDDSKEFPNSIIEVIHQRTKKGYQFSPLGDGSFKAAQPNDDCYTAIDMALESTDPVLGALYFESCKGDSWHNRNLEFLFKSDKTKFYK